MEELKGFVFKKKFGQNFILDTNFLQSLVDCFDLDKDDEVLEVGPGAGTLTKIVASRVKKLRAFEIDTDLKPVLEQQFKDCNNIEVVFKDIMKVDNAEIEGLFPEGFKMVANLPYYITSPIIFKFLECKKIKTMYLMVQLEVGERFSATCGGREYGIPSVLIDSVGKASIVKKVNRKMFFPVPNVDSCILKIEICKDKNKIEDWAKFSQFVHNAFNMKRKTLVNNLSSKYPKTKEEVKQILQQLEIAEDVRPENITTEQYIKLYDKF